MATTRTRCLSTLVDAEGDKVGAHFLRGGRDSFSAVTVSRGIRRAIVHNDAHAPVRQRSNLTHEIAHALLGHTATPVLTEAGHRNFDQGIEAEANFLGGALLITNEAAMHILANQLPNADQVYGVSKAMLNYRLGVSGALKRAQRGSRFGALRLVALG